MTNTQQIEHELYKHCEEKDADAIAWAFTNKDTFVKFPYKHATLLPGEIRANVLYAGLCLSDSLHCRSSWGHCKYPVAPGHEIIGEVAELGSEVKDFKVGEKVGFGTLRFSCNECKFCKLGRESLCSSKQEPILTYGKHFGGYSTTLQQPASHFFHLPENLDFKKSAPLLCAGITVYSPMLKHLKPGMNTAVIGIGGLGHLAVQFLSKLGHKVTAVTTSKNKKDTIFALGASELIDITDEKDLTDNVGKFDFIINTAPSSSNFDKIFNLTASAGFFVQIGLPDVSKQDFTFKSGTLVSREITLVGSFLGSRGDIVSMLKLCADKNIYPVNEEFTFEDFPVALAKLEHGKPIYRCIVNVQDFAKKHFAK